MKRYLREGGWVDLVSAAGLAYLIGCAIKDRP